MLPATPYLFVHSMLRITCQAWQAVSRAPAACCRVRRARAEEKNPKSCAEVFERLVAEGMDPDEVFDAVSTQVGAMLGLMGR